MGRHFEFSVTHLKSLSNYLLLLKSTTSGVGQVEVSLSPFHIEQQVDVKSLQGTCSLNSQELNWSQRTQCI